MSARTLDRLTRRAFLRVAAASATVALGTKSFGPAVARTASLLAGVPALNSGGAITGCAVLGDSLVAVGFDGGGGPGVWRVVLSGGTWEQVAGPEQFPEGASLRDIIQTQGRTCIPGSISTIERKEHSYDEFGELQIDDIIRTVPALFTSGDISEWEDDLASEGGTLGTLTGGAFAGDVGFAVGASFSEIGVNEPHQAIAYRSDPQGIKWVSTPVRDIEPANGEVTLCAAVGKEFLIGVVEFPVSRAYLGAPDGGWTELPSPPGLQPLSFSAAAETDKGILLIAVDSLDGFHYFLLSGEWEEIPPPEGIEPDVRVLDLETTPSGLVAAGVRAHEAIVADVEV